MKKQTNEMRILREFVEEFSPIHQGLTKEMNYDELFDVVAEIVKTHKDAANVAGFTALGLA